MASRRIPSEQPVITGAFLGLLSLALIVVAVTFRIYAIGGAAWFRTFTVVFGSLLISALPFVAVGAIVASAIGVFVPVSAIARISRLPAALQLPAAGLAGIAFPICECGSVPIARRLMLQGLTPSAAITFMLAAPIVNPVVVASTVVAYRGRGSLLTMVGGRLGLGFLVAVVAGWVIGDQPTDKILRRRGRPDVEHVDLGRPEARRRQFFAHLAGDFTFMARYLLVGATVAAVVQTFVPQQPIARLASIPIVDGLVMMALAAILSLCSESDAFIAASFGQYGFGPASQLAFLVFGPMFDLKLGAIYAGTFRRRTFLSLVATTGVLTLAATMWVRMVSG